MAETVVLAWLSHDGATRPRIGDGEWHPQSARPALSDAVLLELQRLGYTWVRLELAGPRRLQRDVSIKALLWGLR